MNLSIVHGDASGNRNWIIWRVCRLIQGKFVCERCSYIKGSRVGFSFVCVRGKSQGWITFYRTNTNDGQELTSLSCINGSVASVGDVFHEHNFQFVRCSNFLCSDVISECKYTWKTVAVFPTIRPVITWGSSPQLTDASGNVLCRSHRPITICKICCRRGKYNVVTGPSCGSINVIL